MKLLGSVGTLGLAVIASSFVAQPVQAGHFVYGCYGYPHYYHSACYSFGWGGYYAPAPVFVAPPPVVYYAPPPVVFVQQPVVYYAPPPVVVQQPAVVQTPPAEQPAPQAAPPPPPPRGPVFVETTRRYHEHGDNAGRLDWVEGLLDGRPIRTYYDDYGRVKKQKWID